MNFGAIIIGDEILSGKRQDGHFAALVRMLAARGLRLTWVEYLGDERSRIAATLARTFASGEAVFCFGGIGNTPDDHTRQAAAEALGVDLVLHPDAEREIRARFADDEMMPRRLLLGAFPRGAAIVPNPVNRIAGFSLHEHYFLPGFPQMAHPMAEWALDTHYAHLTRRPAVDKAFLLSGPNAFESGLLDLMQRIVAEYPDLRLFSLPMMSREGERKHVELGVEGDPARVDAAMEAIREEVERRKIAWKWRE
jgi:molybdopterin-biosynthesis enzyme MoeA-like protein